MLLGELFVFYWTSLEGGEVGEGGQRREGEQGREREQERAVTEGLSKNVKGGRQVKIRK